MIHYTIIQNSNLYCGRGDKKWQTKSETIGIDLWSWNFKLATTFDSDLNWLTYLKFRENSRNKRNVGKILQQGIKLNNSTFSCQCLKKTFLKNVFLKVFIIFQNLIEFFYALIFKFLHFFIFFAWWSLFCVVLFYEFPSKNIIISLFEFQLFRRTIASFR